MKCLFTLSLVAFVCAAADAEAAPPKNCRPSAAGQFRTAVVYPSRPVFVAPQLVTPVASQWVYAPQQFNRSACRGQLASVTPVQSAQLLNTSPSPAGFGVIVNSAESLQYGNRDESGLQQFDIQPQSVPNTGMNLQPAVFSAMNTDGGSMTVIPVTPVPVENHAADLLPTDEPPILPGVDTE